MCDECELGFASGGVGGESKVDRPAGARGGSVVNGHGGILNEGEAERMRKGGEREGDVDCRVLRQGEEER